MTRHEISDIEKMLWLFKAFNWDLQCFVVVVVVVVVEHFDLWADEFYTVGSFLRQNHWRLRS